VNTLIWAHIEPSENVLVLTTGSQVLDSATFSEILLRAGINSVRVSKYGMKSSVDVFRRIISVAHGEFTIDIGRNFNSPTIDLSRCDLPGSMNVSLCGVESYGSTRVVVGDVELTVYPRLLHFLKSRTSFRVTIPRKVLAARRLVGYLRTLIGKLTSSSENLGGFRKEVRISGDNFDALLGRAEEIFSTVRIFFYHLSIETYLSTLRLLETLEVHGTNANSIEDGLKRSFALTFNVLGLWSGKFDRFLPRIYRSDISPEFVQPSPAPEPAASIRSLSPP